MAKDRDVKREKDFSGRIHENIYEDGHKVGEFCVEEGGGFLGFGTEMRNVEYDRDGRQIGYSRHEERGGFLGLGSHQVEAAYDSRGNSRGYSQVERRGGFLGIGDHHERIGYDEDDQEVTSTRWEKRGGFLGIGEQSARVTRSSGRGTASFGRSISGEGGDLEDGLVKLIIGVFVVCIVVWFVFSILIPLVIIDAAAITLFVASLTERHRRAMFAVSTVSSGYVLLDYNAGWITQSLAHTLPFLWRSLVFLVYMNVVCGLVSSYLLLRKPVVQGTGLGKLGSSRKRKLASAGSLIGIGIVIFGAQSYIDLHRHDAPKTSRFPSVLTSVPCRTSINYPCPAAPPASPSSPTRQTSNANIGLPAVASVAASEGGNHRVATPSDSRPIALEKNEKRATVATPESDNGGSAQAKISRSQSADQTIGNSCVWFNGRYVC